MKLETTGFTDGKENTQFKCGMYTSPYMTLNQCRRLATRIVTDEAFLAYRKYWKTWNSSHIARNNIPMMHLRLICDEHLDMIKNLPDNPRERIRRNGYSGT